jgi:hypothetical protein
LIEDYIPDMTYRTKVMTPEHLDRFTREALTRATNETFVDERETPEPDTAKEDDETQAR